MADSALKTVTRTQGNNNALKDAADDEPDHGYEGRG